MCICVFIFVFLYLFWFVYPFVFRRVLSGGIGGFVRRGSDWICHQHSSHCWVSKIMINMYYNVFGISKFDLQVNHLCDIRFANNERNWISHKHMLLLNVWMCFVECRTLKLSTISWLPILYWTLIKYLNGVPAWIEHHFPIIPPFLLGGDSAPWQWLAAGAA